MQIAEWLSKLDLGQYVWCVADNDIDVSVLCHLTDQDLKELGVSLGHRRKMLAAIADGVSTMPSTTKVPNSLPHETAER